MYGAAHFFCCLILKNEWVVSDYLISKQSIVKKQGFRSKVCHRIFQMFFNRSTTKPKVVKHRFSFWGPISIIGLISSTLVDEKDLKIFCIFRFAKKNLPIRKKIFRFAKKNLRRCFFPPAENLLSNGEEKTCPRHNGKEKNLPIIFDAIKFLPAAQQNLLMRYRYIEKLTWIQVLYLAFPPYSTWLTVI